MKLQILERRDLLSAVPFSSMPSLEDPSTAGVRMAVAGDLNGDNQTDVVAFSKTDSQLLWLPRNGDNAFDEPRRIGRLSSMSETKLADVDGDSDLDIIVANFFEILWFENEDGQGTFGDPQIIESPIFLRGSEDELFVTDFDGNGQDDILALTETAIYRFSFDNNAQAFQKSSLLERSSTDSVIGIDDLDSDGDVDIVLRERAGGARSLRNDAGQISEWQTLHVDSVRSAYVGDFDSDRDIDILFLHPTNSLLFENTDGAGDFRQRSIEVSVDTYRMTLQSARTANLLDDVGDEIFSIRSDSVSILQVIGSELVQVRELDIDGDQIAAFDMDGDADLDFIVSNRDKNTIEWLENAEGQFDIRHDVYSTNNLDRPTSPQFVDLDGDSDLDVLVTSPNGAFWYQNLDGNGAFSVRQSLGVDASNFVQAIDVDGDNDLDLIAGHQSQILWYQNVGDQTYGDGVTIASFSTWDPTSVIKLEDLDQNGHPDVVFTHGGSVLWIPNDGAGQFSELTRITSDLRLLSDFEISDIDADGKQDIIAVSFDEKIPTWYQHLDGVGGFSRAKTLTDRRASTSRVIVADMDADGDEDIVLTVQQNTSTSNVIWLENQNSGRDFDTLHVAVPTTLTFNFLVSDVDMDGLPDIVRTALDLQWHENPGDRTAFGDQNAILTQKTGGIPNVIDGDIDGDGDLDYLMYSARNDSIVLARNELISRTIRGDFNGDQRISTEDIDLLRGQISLGSRLAEFDLNLDGKIDNDDSTTFVHDIAQTSFGDANLDGVFDSQDLVLVFQAGLYDTQETASWISGDWNGDGRFDSTDIVLAFQDGGFVA